MASNYHDIYRTWQQDGDEFWAAAARQIDWYEPWDAVFDPQGGVYGSWFPGATCNTCYNCLDRHVERGRPGQPALIYDSPITGQSRTYSYMELLEEVQVFAAVLETQGIAK
ncbi:MAG: acetyl-coenzyme A synthetase N-terminal domain-containing protein, partial [Hyphomicrobiales bacterium]